MTASRILAVASLSFMMACATTPTTLKEVESCRAASQEVAGRLEARKRMKGAYAKSLDVLSKDEGPIPTTVNGFPLEYRRTSKGFELECKFEQSGLNVCTMDHLGGFKCARPGEEAPQQQPRS